VGLLILAAVVWSDWFFSGISIGVAIFLLALIGMHEFYSAISNIGYKPVRTIGYAACLPILMIALGGTIKKVDKYVDLFKSINYFSFGIFVTLVVLFSFIIFLHDRYNINDIAVTVFGALYVSFLFSFLVLTRNLENGFYYIWLIFIGAWVTDTFAYFSGVFFGRTKFLPAISPKKTVEGSIGGIAGCVVITVIYGLFLNSYIRNVPVFHYVIIGLLSGILSQIGDWAASAVKRYVKIKDYGKLMPGHGGVLDRFDSILFIAPVVYFYISFAL